MLSAAAVAVVVAGAIATGVTVPTSSTTVPPTTPAAVTTAAPTEPSGSTLYPSVEEFVGRWNEANALFAEQMSPAVHLPIDPAAIVLRPVDEEHSFFDWHFPASGYIGGLVDNATGAVALAAVAGEGDSPLLTSAAGTLLFMLTAENPDDSVTMAEAFVAFAEDAQPGDAEYVAAGPSAMSLLAFDGVDRQYPWIAVVASPPSNAEQAIDDAETLTRLIAGTAVPPAPAPGATVATTTTAATATTVPVATSGPAGAVAAPSTTAFPSVSLAPPTVTVAPTTLPGPPLTTAAPVAGALFASLDDLAARWNEKAVASASGSAIAVSTDDMVLVVVDEPQDVFATWIDESSYLGGAVEADSEHGVLLAAVVVPTRATATDVVTTAVNVSAPEFLAQAMAAYVGVIGDAPGTHTYLPAESTDLVISVLESAADGIHLVAVTAAPRTDEATAVANATWINETLPHTLTLADPP